VPRRSNTTTLTQASDAWAALTAASDACGAAFVVPDLGFREGSSFAQDSLGLIPEAPTPSALSLPPLQLAPGWADAWVNYVIARYRQAHIEDAKIAMRQALVNLT
jgi:hypothetical protein